MGDVMQSTVVLMTRTASMHSIVISQLDGHRAHKYQRPDQRVQAQRWVMRVGLQQGQRFGVRRFELRVPLQRGFITGR
jgi:hypothetical protein